MQLIYCLVLLALFWLAVRAFTPAAEKNELETDDEPEEEMSYSEISEKINDLNDHKQKVDEINELIADVASCAPGQVHKTVSVHILESNHKMHFTITGQNDVSKLFLQILENEREIHSTSLRKAMRKIK